jgi:hypothetical protein
MKRLVLTLAFIVTCISYLQATTYYVSLNGSDNRTGISKAQAWYSFDYAMSQMKPGDVMVIEDGVYSQPINISKSGTASAPIIIRGQSKDGVVIQGTTAGINISNQDNVTVEDITINGGSQGAYIINSRHVILRRINIFKVSQVAIWFRDRNDDFLVTECNIEDMTGTGNNGWGIRVNDDNGGKRGKGVIERCVFRNGWRAGARLEDTIVDLYDNIFENWGGDGGRDHGVYYGNGAPEYDDGATTIIEGNIFRGNLGYGLKISCWYDPANIIVRNNIFAENRYGGLIITFGVDGVKAYNNTFYNNKGSNLQINAYNYKSDKYNKNLKIKNNLFYSTEGELVLLMDDSVDGLEMDYNCYYSTKSTKFRIRKNPTSYTSYSSFSAWQNNSIASWVDEHSIFQDPRLTNPEQGDYTIQKNSPCIDFGIALNEVNYDFNNIPRPSGSGCDIGAYELAEGYSSINEISTAVPEQFNMQQNYPNPFNSETAISYQIPISCHVMIEVFNFLGQNVRILVNEEKNAGTYHAIWDGLNKNGLPVSSGIYFYEMHAGNFTGTKKMLFVR